MVNQEQTSGPQSETGFSSKNVMEEEGLILKIRKPYTISKQRERWAEEEHEKFLEALKLHGRAWKKIEEHIGTKTAVQIRSHAQKFFSKVVRDTNVSNVSSTETIEIPPPRPKRKPSHPYPRNAAFPTTNENPTDLRTRSTSPSSSICDRETQSPTSVLSALGSDTLASADSTALDGSPSPVSSAEDVDAAEILPSEDTTPQDDVHICPPAKKDIASLELDLFPSIDSYDKSESVSTKTLKLFGMDVVVPIEPTESSMRLSKSPSPDMGEELLQASPEEVQPMENDTHTAEYPWDCRAFYYVGESGNPVDRPIPLPWWVFFRGMVAPPFGSQVENTQEKENLREGSCAGSSSETVNEVGNIDNHWDAESQSDKESKNETKPKTVEPAKGFVPYKKRLSERVTQSSTESISEKEGKRIRVCL